MPHLVTWLCMKDMVHGCMVQQVAAVSHGTSHISAVSTPLQWKFKNVLKNASHSCKITCQCCESDREWRIVLYKKQSSSWLHLKHKIKWFFLLCSDTHLQFHFHSILTTQSLGQLLFQILNVAFQLLLLALCFLTDHSTWRSRSLELFCVCASTLLLLFVCVCLCVCKHFILNWKLNFIFS